MNKTETTDSFHQGNYPVPLNFRYTGHTGETADRSLLNVTVTFGHSDFHPDVPYGWFLVGNDLNRDLAVRYFPLVELLQPAQTIFLLGVPRSSKWVKVRADYLQANSACAACGARKMLNIHHVLPYHLHPDLELDPSNLITLCETPSHNCHFLIGHLLDWRAYNPQVREDAAALREKIKVRKYD